MPCERGRVHGLPDRVLEQRGVLGERRLLPLRVGDQMRTSGLVRERFTRLRAGRRCGSVPTGMEVHGVDHERGGRVAVLQLLAVSGAP